MFFYIAFSRLLSQVGLPEQQKTKCYPCGIIENALWFLLGMWPLVVSLVGIGMSFTSFSDLLYPLECCCRSGSSPG